MPVPPPFSADDYRQALANLLPRGRVWPREPDSVFARMLGALAPTYARGTAAAGRLVADSLPTTTTDLLPEWEASLGLPDDCAGPGQSIAQRVAAVAARWAARGGQSPAYYVRLAAALGFDITIAEYQASRYGRSRFGARYQGPEWAHAWSVMSRLNTATRARFGTARFGDRYVSFGNAVLECEIANAAPAHSRVLFRYWRDQFDLTAGVADELTFARASTGTYFDADGVLQSAAAGVSRQDHDPVTLAPLGTLLEPVGTNSLRYSGDISNAVWGKFGAPTVTANAAVAPDGTMTAASALLSPTSGFYQSVSAGGGQSWIGSIWLRADTPGIYRMTATGSAAGPRTQSIAVTTTWQRFPLGVTLAAGSDHFGLQIDGTGGGGLVYAWGGQSELGTVASSYIPTTGAPATRAADTLSLALPYEGFSGQDGWTALLECVPKALPGNTVALGLAGAAGFDDTTYALVAANGSVAAVKRVGGAGAVSAVAGAVSAGSVARIAIAQDASDARISVSGAPAVVAAEPGYPVMTRLTIGGSPWGVSATTQPIWARRLRLWPRKLSDAEMMAAFIQ